VSFLVRTLATTFFDGHHLEPHAHAWGQLIFAATGVELRGVVDSMGEGPQRTFAAVRALVSPLDDDREMSTDMTRMARIVAGPRC